MVSENLCRYCSTLTTLLDAEGLPICADCQITEPAPLPGQNLPPEPKPEPKPEPVPVVSWRDHLVSAAQLQGMDFPPLTSYIEGLVIEGMTVFAGKPKLGKSWWVYRAGLTIATGGVAFGNPERKVTDAPVLYLALEDGHRRAQDRMSRLMAPGESWPDNFRIATHWDRFSAGGLEQLAEAIDEDGYRVVFIDTLAKVRVPKRGRGDSYQEDSDALSMIHELTRERPGLALEVVHHSNKATHDDFVDSLSGTTGIGGVPDHVVVLTRGRGEADGVIQFTSRDAPEHETAFSFDGAAWSELGEAKAIELSKARKALYDLLVDLDRPASLAELARMLGKAEPPVLRQLRGLAEEGLAHQDGDRGPWVAT